MEREGEELLGWRERGKENVQNAKAEITGGKRRPLKCESRTGQRFGCLAWISAAIAVNERRWRWGVFGILRESDAFLFRLGSRRLVLWQVDGTSFFHSFDLLNLVTDTVSRFGTGNYYPGQRISEYEDYFTFGFRKRKRVVYDFGEQIWGKNARNFICECVPYSGGGSERQRPYQDAKLQEKNLP